MFYYINYRNEVLEFNFLKWCDNFKESSVLPIHQGVKDKKIISDHEWKRVHFLQKLNIRQMNEKR